MAKTSIVDRELARAEAVVAGIKKRKDLHVKAYEFAKTHGYTTIHALVAFLYPASEPKTPKRVRTRGKPKADGKRSVKTPQLVAKIKALRKSGKTWAAIEKATGVGIQTLPKWAGSK